MSKKAKIDGRLVSEPTISGADTVFTVEGSSPWSSASKYIVHLKGPNSFYEYRTLSESVDDPQSGGLIQKTITIKGNDSDRITRYRDYILSLNKEDFWGFWKRLFNEQPDLLIKKKNGGCVNYQKVFK